MNRLLIVVDFQNDFVTGPLGFQKAIDIAPVLINKIKDYKKSNDEIIFTLDTHYENYMSTIEGTKLPVLHCQKGTKGHQLYGELLKLSKNCMVIEKDTFPSLDLANYLKNKTYSSVEVCGIISNICVISNVVMVKSALPNTPIIVDYLATASNDDTLNEKAFDIMENLHVNIINRP